MIIRQLIFDTESSDVDEIDWRTTARVAGRYVFLAGAVGLFLTLLVLAAA